EPAECLPSVWAGLYGPLWCVLPSEGSVSVHSPTECPRPCCEALCRAMTSRFDTQHIAVVNARTRSSIHTGCRSEEHTSELQSRENLVCRLLLEKKNKSKDRQYEKHNVTKLMDCA